MRDAGLNHCPWRCVTVIEVLAKLILGSPYSEGLGALAAQRILNLSPLLLPRKLLFFVLEYWLPGLKYRQPSTSKIHANSRCIVVRAGER